MIARIAVSYVAASASPVSVTAPVPESNELVTPPIDGAFAQRKEQIIQYLREGAADGSLAPDVDVFESADVAFNAVAWPYVHLRGRHGWPAERAAARVVDVVLNGLAPPSTESKRGKE